MVNDLQMDTLTIEIRNPKVRELLTSLAEMELLTILPQPPTWAERWKKLSASLPNEPQISEQEILDEISQVRAARK